MSKEKKETPELRFPEFVKDGEWVEQDLIQVADKNVKWSFTGGPFGSDLKASEYTSNGVRIIQLQNIGDGKFNGEYKIYTSMDKADELMSSNIFAGDIIISKMGDPVGRACIIPEDLKRCVMASDGIRLVVNEKKNSKYFIYSLINSKRIRKKIERKATGSTRKRIALKNLKKIPLPLPKKTEQQKIAACLSSLDKLIAAHNYKLEALKDHKKGLLQNLFPQKDEKVPKYRFPEFEKDGEWVEMKLGDEEVSEFVNDKINKQKLKLSNYISTGNMLPDYAGITEATKLPTTKRVTRFIEGDVLVSNIRPYLKKVWKADRKGGASNDVLVFRSGLKLMKEFLEYIIKNDRFINYVMKSVKGVKMPRGDKDSMMKYPIRIPDPVEQEKIASCLSNVDKLIRAQSKKVEQLHQQKKGLVQGLFPNVED